MPGGRFPITDTVSATRCAVPEGHDLFISDDQDVLRLLDELEQMSSADDDTVVGELAEVTP
jgi:hypothetical protein